VTLPKRNIEFEYLTSNSDRFTNDFMNFVLTDVPFFALQDQLLFLMEKRQHSKFRIPGYLTTDSKDHIFYFDRLEDQNNSNILRYRYRGMDIVEKPSGGNQNGS